MDYWHPLWGATSDSNIEILQHFQSRNLQTMVNAPWYISSNTLHRDLKHPTVREDIQRVSKRYIHKLETHPNSLAVNLLDNKP